MTLLDLRAASIARRATRLSRQVQRPPRWVVTYRQGRETRTLEVPEAVSEGDAIGRALKARIAPEAIVAVQREGGSTDDLAVPKVP